MLFILCLAAYIIFELSDRFSDGAGAIIMLGIQANRAYLKDS